MYTHQLRCWCKRRSSLWTAHSLLALQANAHWQPCHNTNCMMGAWTSHGKQTQKSIPSPWRTAPACVNVGCLGMFCFFDPWRWSAWLGNKQTAKLPPPGHGGPNPPQPPASASGNNQIALQRMQGGVAARGLHGIVPLGQGCGGPADRRTRPCWPRAAAAAAAGPATPPLQRHWLLVFSSFTLWWLNNTTLT